VQRRSLRVLRPGGILVSSVSPVPEPVQRLHGIRAAYFYVEVTTARLNKLRELFDVGKLVTNVGTVLSLRHARIAHELLANRRRRRGKIVLRIGSPIDDSNAQRRKNSGPAVTTSGRGQGC
jgi:hypothetical protein